MQTSRLGCLSSSGVIAGLATIIVIAGLALTQGGVLYNPGPLNAQTGELIGGVTSHAELGGDCGKCHVAPWGVSTMADRCTACHLDIAVQMREVASLHGTMSHKNPNLMCAHCHPDHRGKDAPLTIATGDDFPHEEMGYSLKGHQRTEKKEPFACRDCHTDGIARFDPVVCLDCHVQLDAEFTTAHQTNWGGGCLSCHDGVDRYGSDFDHDKYSFQLIGGHVQAACYACHPGAHTIADLQSTQTTCVACHLAKDPHEGRFGTDCAGCHNTANWNEASFDHSKSAFPLTGAHMQVQCAQCHTNNQFAGTSSACVSCHVDPVFHAGYFGTECSSCHSTTAWSPAKFDQYHPEPAVDEEGSGIYHGGTTCLTCHPTTVSVYTCLACHSNNQGGEGGGGND